MPDIGPITVVLSGPSAVDVFFEGPNEGDAEDDNFNGLDEVSTQMVDLQLTGRIRR